MLYKVTPMLPGPEAKPKKARDAAQPRKKRKSAVYDHEGHEVLITLMCLKCRSIKPLAQFGLRKMADGAIRNQPWCRGCRSGAGVPKAKTEIAPVQSGEAAGEAEQLDASPVELSVIAPPTPVLIGDAAADEIEESAAPTSDPFVAAP